jgi:hypothetical protein
MLEKGFISEISRYERISLGSVERHFLTRFCHIPMTAYRLWKILEINKARHKMAYKNVHKRVKRLYELGLLQEVKGEYPRNAKPYKLTSRGLFEMLLVPQKHGFPNPDICNNYKDDTIVQNIVYQFFEPETIARFDLGALSWLQDYLTKCCEVIMRLVDETQHMSKKSQEHHPLEYLLDSQIRKEVKDFVMRIVTVSGEDNEDKENTIFPNLTLARDKKFLNLLYELKNEFEKGSGNFI